MYESHHVIIKRIFPRVGQGARGAVGPRIQASKPDQSATAHLFPLALVQLSHHLYIINNYIIEYKAINIYHFCSFFSNFRSKIRTFYRLNNLTIR